LFINLILYFCSPKVENRLKELEMYAIVDIAGQQFKVEEGKKIFVHRLDNKEGDNIDIDEVLLIDQDGKVMVGQPIVKGAKVTAKVIDHVRGDKVKVFKKKRRKGYQVLNGHRQDFTQIQIETIVEKGAEKKAAAKKETPAAKPAEKKTVAKKVAEPKVEAKEEKAVKKPAVKKPAVKKPVAKKTATTAAKPVAKKKVKKATATKKTTAKKATAKPAAKATKKEDKKD
jgi:large subunit ribosomal protein L21